MSTFFVAILSGLVWMGLYAEIGWGSFALGALLGLGVWRLAGERARRPFGPVRALRLIGLGVRFVGLFVWDLLTAVAQQVVIILSPRIELQPGWIRFRTELESPPMRALLGVVLSLTPGSLVYEESVSEDGACELSLHVLDLRDEEGEIRRIRSRLEAPLRAMETL